MSGGESSDRLETAIREVNARITEEVVNLRARLVALEQRLESLGREEVEEPPRRKRRAGRAKGAARLKGGPRIKGERREKAKRAKAAAAQRKKRRPQASKALEDSEAEGSESLENPEG